MPNTNNITLLDNLGASIVYMMEEVGVFHYNKLSYLFEYFYIKNFGKRYTKERFVKFPKGPVIKSYKGQLSELSKKNIINVDEDLLLKSRKLNDDYKEKVFIKVNDNTKNFIFADPLALSLLESIVSKYGHLNIEDLGKLVYSTQPMIKFQENVKNGFQKDSGYVLRSSNFKIRKAQDHISDGLKIALKHIQKYPTINYTQYKEQVKEFGFLENFRPTNAEYNI